ncbi:MAG: TfoX/Sxy family protein [Actinomycetes bacterium]
MEKRSFARPTEADVAWFDALLPDLPGVSRRKMFGNVAGFSGDAMFLCLFGDRVAVRLDEDDRARLLAEPGTEQFEPMPGRPMREYVVLPGTWRDDPARAHEWVGRSAAYAATVPPKKKPAKK